MLLFVLTASAQTPPSEAEVSEPPRREVRYRDREEIIFEGVGVQGAVVGPELTRIEGWPKPRFDPLVKLRENWNDELKVSVDAVK